MKATIKKIRPRFKKIPIPEKRYHAREIVNDKIIVGQFHYYQRAMKLIREINKDGITPFLAKLPKYYGLFYVLIDSKRYKYRFKYDDDFWHRLSTIIGLGLGPKTYIHELFEVYFEQLLDEPLRGIIIQ